MQRSIFSGAINGVSAEPGSGGEAPGARSRGSARITQQYAYAINGFAAAGLSDVQVQALRAHPKVLSITPNRMRYTQTITTPAYLNVASGVWQKQYNGAENAGAGVLVGVVDTGIEYARESFAKVARSSNPWPDLGPDSGVCAESGTCTDGKLLGCQYFQASIMDYAASNGFLIPGAGSCHDDSGHGTHTAGTAAGNTNATAVVGGAGVSPPTMSGMAPGAAVAAYKALWHLVSQEDPSQTVDSGTTADILKAINQAVRDGVDIINYSAGSEPSNFTFLDPVWTAFGNAAIAGVFVSAAGGNAGDPTTVDNNVPWAITVAAGTHDRVQNASVTLSPGGATFSGATLPAKGVGPAPLHFPGAANASASLCLDGALDGGAAGKIVVCLRGTNPRVAKSAEVARAGGVGMILANLKDSEGLVNDVHSVPSIHVNRADGEAIITAYNAAPGAVSATLSGATFYLGSEAPFVADFSSRGPSISDSSALLKPDILAPGVDIVAAWPSANVSNDTANVISGTSMAAPHIAGIAALIMGKHSDWSPAAIKSAIMTTASQVTNKGNPLTGTPFDYGAGMVDPVKAMDPGLVYDAGERDIFRYYCATFKDPSIKSKVSAEDLAQLFENGKPVQPSDCKQYCKPACSFPQTVRDTNVPSFSFNGTKKGSTVRATRNVTFVGAGSASFTPEVKLPDGFTYKIKPLTPKLTALSFSAPGQWKAYTLSITVPRMAPSGWQFGSITWKDDQGRYSVRSAIAINAA